MTLWQSFGLTLLVLLAHGLIRRIIRRSLLVLGRSKQVSESRVGYVEHVFHFLLGSATLLVLAGVWGLDFSRLVVLASSFFAVLGVAMVAQWSILSNITASITIFFAFPYRIGDRIRILDKDDSVTGVILEIGLFYVQVRDDQGDLVTYPANLFLQRPVRRLESSPHPQVPDQPE
ncbi:mechanosensitive ion channel domain-containing protein [Aeromonas rivuli]|jgi:small-conductance mechanosensitive channel|uniref:mechanosensitive ion channel domain-containing protein n=1 Tax=Aeromonas TaxID=642 RepID=UPI0005AA6382|nr:MULTISPECIES: mechanosensitive ion channel domain-containing protein [Aeromonas]MCS3456723.1 small-conductance mechanosensitive channel [Aeromonas sp. BIGb0405]UBO73672.1 mechanosensitive ion channel family protein [Aeromonas rivuli]